MSLENHSEKSDDKNILKIFKKLVIVSHVSKRQNPEKKILFEHHFLTLLK